MFQSVGELPHSQCATQISASPKHKSPSDVMSLAQSQSNNISQAGSLSHTTAYNTLMSTSPYALFQPRNSITTTHQICLQQHPATILQASPHPSPYTVYQPGTTLAPGAVFHAIQYSPAPLLPHPTYSHQIQQQYIHPNPTDRSHLIPVASTLAAAIGRSSSTPGLVESAGKVGLEEMILPPALHPLPSLARMAADHSQHHFLHHHQQQRSSPYSPAISPTIR